MTEGPPEVVLVAVASESLGEAATFCSSEVTPERTNGYYCPEENPDQVAPVDDVQPLGFYARIAFDELLDPSIETVDEANGVASLSGTPVTLKCGGADVAYTGFYDPSGSHLTYPAGPALVIEANATVATGSACTVEIGDSVKDKDGEAVPSGQRGPYGFTIAPLAAFGTSPEADAEDVDPAVEMGVIFNNYIDDASLAGKVTLHDDTGNADVVITVGVSADDPTFLTVAADAGALAENNAYTLTVADGITDVEGGALSADNAVTFSFTTGAAM